MKKPSVCILGVGFVGLTLAAALSKAGMLVYGLDIDAKLVSNLNNGVTTIKEPGLEKILLKGLSNKTLKFYNSIDDLSLLQECEYFILTVGTPLKDGIVNNELIENALNSILDLISENATIILRSTTKVGTANQVQEQIMKHKKSFHIAMCPERTVEGNALDELQTLPQIIGADDEKSFQKARFLFESLGVECVRVSSLRAAELTKLINNTYRDLMFGYSNEIALLASSLGISAIEVINAANYKYARSNIALPGPSGGPCLEKDPWILAESGKSVGVNMLITSSARRVNEELPVKFLLENVNLLKSYKKIALLGLSFKGVPEVLDSRGSVSKLLVRFLVEKFPNTSIVGYEPAGLFVNDFSEIEQCESLDKALVDTDLLIITTKSQSFYSIETLISSKSDSTCLILDFWNLLQSTELGKKQIYRALG